MPIGPTVRRLFGPYEPEVTEAWRAVFIDLTSFVTCVRQWVPNAVSILEVGCGEGAVTSRLASAYPDASITAIDITPRLGRMFQSDRPVRFELSTVEQLAEKEAGCYDLVILCDVLHHVPEAARRSLLEGIGKMLTPAGAFVFKDWERRFVPIHWLCYASDRFITGDKVNYLDGPEIRSLLRRVYGRNSIVDEARIRPRQNNLAVLIRT